MNKIVICIKDNLEGFSECCFYTALDEKEGKYLVKNDEGDCEWVNVEYFSSFIGSLV